MQYSDSFQLNQFADFVYSLVYRNQYTELWNGSNNSLSFLFSVSLQKNVLINIKSVETKKNQKKLAKLNFWCLKFLPKMFLNYKKKTMYGICKI